jgi:hypothetical protein
VFPGISEEEIWEKANELYTKKHDKNQEFQYPECYWVLKDRPRWSMPFDNLKGDKGTAASSDVTEDAAPSLSFTRPIGTKRAKENVRQMKPQADVGAISAQSQQLMAETSRERLRVLEKQNLLNLIAFPMEGLDPSRRAFVESWQETEIRNFKEKYLEVEADEPVESQDIDERYLDVQLDEPAEGQATDSLCSE